MRGFPDGTGRPFLWDAPCGAPHATNPSDEAGTPPRPRDEVGLRPMPPAAPIRSCSRWGLPCRPCCQGRGALLPHRFTLARGSWGKPLRADPGCAGGLFSVALSLRSPPPAVSRHRIPVEPGLSSNHRLSRQAAVVRPSGGRDMRARAGVRQAPPFALRGVLAIGASSRRSGRRAHSSIGTAADS